MFTTFTKFLTYRIYVRKARINFAKSKRLQNRKALADRRQKAAENRLSDVINLIKALMFGLLGFVFHTNTRNALWRMFWNKNRTDFQQAVLITLSAALVIIFANVAFAALAPTKYWEFVQMHTVFWTDLFTQTRQNTIDAQCRSHYQKGSNIAPLSFAAHGEGEVVCSEITNLSPIRDFEWYAYLPAIESQCQQAIWVEGVIYGANEISIGGKNARCSLIIGRAGWNQPWFPNPVDPQSVLVRVLHPQSPEFYIGEIEIEEFDPRDPEIVVARRTEIGFKERYNQYFVASPTNSGFPLFYRGVFVRMAQNGAEAGYVLHESVLADGVFIRIQNKKYKALGVGFYALSNADNPMCYQQKTVGSQYRWFTDTRAFTLLDNTGAFATIAFSGAKMKYQGEVNGLLAVTRGGDPYYVDPSTVRCTP